MFTDYFIVKETTTTACTICSRTFEATHLVTTDEKEAEERAKKALSDATKLYDDTNYEVIAEKEIKQVLGKLYVKVVSTRNELKTIVISIDKILN